MDQGMFGSRKEAESTTLGELLEHYLCERTIKKKGAEPEACASAHHWGRELQSRGYTVKLIPLHFVKLYVKSNKNDTRDAEAICEAMSRDIKGDPPRRLLKQIA